jgi:peptide deformylase
MKDYEDENYKTIAMVNPEIIEHSEKKEKAEEGCLSVPGEIGDVERWSWVKVAFIDPEGRKYALKLEALAARIVQHEIDHLNGVLFIDKAENIEFIK